MEPIKYTKLKDLIDGQFTVEGVGRYTYKMWSEGEKRFVASETPQEGFRKVYPVETDKGKLDLGAGQIGALLEAVLKDGEASLVGKTFGVKSNGKSGIDVRYYFNPVAPVAKDQTVTAEDLSLDIPF